MDQPESGAAECAHGPRAQKLTKEQFKTLRDGLEKLDVPGKEGPGKAEEEANVLPLEDAAPTKRCWAKTPPESKKRRKLQEASSELGKSPCGKEIASYQGGLLLGLGSS